jgi:hypothetical protein
MAIRVHAIYARRYDGHAPAARRKRAAVGSTINADSHAGTDMQSGAGQLAAQKLGYPQCCGAGASATDHRQLRIRQDTRVAADIQQWRGIMDGAQ